MEAPPHGNATFVFRFETDETHQGHFGKKGDEYFGKEGVSKATLKGYFGKNKNWSDSSSGGGGGENGKKKNKNSSKSKSLLKTSSFSSSSSASSAASSSVMEWASPEENELKNKEGFSLVVYAWKS
ncbi:uncharacterized protein A4U43_C08F7770 [Asparagus officinalis]|nr:uncharacterized protein A4U43_C08F7770 [Asparagus officinalis]